MKMESHTLLGTSWAPLLTSWETLGQFLNLSDRCSSNRKLSTYYAPDTLLGAEEERDKKQDSILVEGDCQQMEK